MTWNHRVIRETQPDGSEWLGIHEVHYREDGRPRAYTAEPIGVVGETLEELAWVLDHMRIALGKPVLSDADFEPPAPAPQGQTEKGSGGRSTGAKRRVRLSRHAARDTLFPIPGARVE
jgi:hypothetical protein